MKILTPNKETIKNCIIAIGQELIERAEDISRDVDGVTSISIYAKLDPTEIVNFDITKNYYAGFKEDKKDE